MGERVRRPVFQVIYNQKNITTDVSPYLSSITYKDAIEGKCDEVQVRFTDHLGRWADEWYVTFGDTFQVSMGFGTQLLPCGVFEIDETEAHIGPDAITIKALAAGIKDATREKRTDQHENKTLRQIAQKVADRYGYTIQGNIEDTGEISRVTQVLEPDLTFLRNLAAEYGHLFSVRHKVITFTSIYELEAVTAAATIDRADLLPGSNMRDKTAHTYKKLHLVDYDNDSRKVYETEFEFPEITNSDGFTYNGIVKTDVKQVRARVDNQKQALMKAKAALHSSNSKQQEGRLVINGNPYVVSGVNVELTGWGKYSGIYHVISSEHELMPGGGYTTTAMVKRVGYIDVVKTKRKQSKKRKPVHVKIVQ